MPQKVMTEREFRRDMDKLHDDILAGIEKHATPFEDTSEEATAERKRRARIDTQYYAETYMPHYIKAKSPAFHFLIDDAIENPTYACGVLAPRGFAKTTRGVTINGTKTMCFGRYRYSRIWSDIEREAIRKLFPIKTEFESNPRIIQDFGNMIGSRWDDEFIVTNKGDVYEAVSWRSASTRGAGHLDSRPDNEGLDDLENRQSSLSKTQCKARYDWVTGDLMPAMVMNGGCFMWYGTLLSPISAFKMFLEDTDENGLPLRRIIKEYDFIDGNEENDPTWPEWAPREVLEHKMREWGRSMYLREMRHITTNPDPRFRPEWIHTYNRAELDLNRLIIYRSGDPTDGGDCKAAITTWGFDPELCRMYLLQCYNRRATKMDFLKKIAQFEREIPAVNTFIEEQLYKNFIEEVIREKFPHLVFSTIQNHLDKKIRIETLESPFENGWFYFDPKIGDTADFIEDIKFYDKLANDGLDATEMVYRHVRWHHLGEPGEYESLDKRASERIVRGYLGC